MSAPVIMSEEFQKALQKEINLIGDVVKNYDDDENIFELEDYKRYASELSALKDWLITK